MQHILYKDKNEQFECKIAVEGTDLSKAQARLVLENVEHTLLFKGDIDSQGKCSINIGKLKFLSENLVGTLKLEVIIDDDTYFIPYESEFKMGVSKKVRAEVVEEKSKTVLAKTVTVEVISKPTPVQSKSKIWAKAINETSHKLTNSKSEYTPTTKTQFIKETISEAAVKHSIPNSDLVWFNNRILKEVLKNKRQ